MGMVCSPEFAAAHSAQYDIIMVNYKFFKGPAPDWSCLTKIMALLKPDGFLYIGSWLSPDSAVKETPVEKGGYKYPAWSTILFDVPPEVSTQPSISAAINTYMGNRFRSVIKQNRTPASPGSAANVVVDYIIVRK